MNRLKIGNILSGLFAGALIGFAFNGFTGSLVGGVIGAVVGYCVKDNL